MQTWAEFRVQIQSWAKQEITDDEFYGYLTTSEFECDADRRVAAIFIRQHDGGEWTHAIYHRM